VPMTHCARCSTTPLGSSYRTMVHDSWTRLRRLFQSCRRSSMRSQVQLKYTSTGGFAVAPTSLKQWLMARGLCWLGAPYSGDWQSAEKRGQVCPGDAASRIRLGHGAGRLSRPRRYHQRPCPHLVDRPAEVAAAKDRRPQTRKPCGTPDDEIVLK